MTPRTLAPTDSLVPGSREHPAGCGACGAALLSPDGDLGAPCPLCAAPGLRPQPALAVHPPEGVVPFRLERADLAGPLGAFVRGAWFRVPDLEVARLVERARPVWLPAWWVDGSAKGVFEAEVALRYVVRSSVDRYVGGAWKSEAVEEDRERWEPRVGQVDLRLDNVELPARADAGWFAEHLGAWDRSAPLPADPATVDRAACLLPDRAEPEVRPEALAALNARFAAEVQRAAGAVGVRSFRLEQPPTDLHWTWLLLPAWSTWYADADGRRHVVWVHGQSGRVAGPRMSAPWKWLGCAAVLFGLAVAAGVIGAIGAFALFWIPPVAVVGLVVLCVAALLALAALVPVEAAWGANRRELALARPTGASGGGPRGTRAPRP